MTYITHALGGALAGSAVIAAVGVQDKVTAAAIMTGAVAGSLLPDIDHTRSKISKSSAAAQAASYAVSAVFKHRGALHTPLFILIVAVIAGTAIQVFLQGNIETVAWSCYFGLLPGMLSHLILDSFNPGGIMWLYPIEDKRYNIMSIKTSSLGETAVTITLAACVALICGVDITNIVRGV